MFYLIGIVLALLGLFWILNGALFIGVIAILVGLFVAGYFPSNGRRF